MSETKKIKFLLAKSKCRKEEFSGGEKKQASNTCLLRASVCYVLHMLNLPKSYILIPELHLYSPNTEEYPQRRTVKLKFIKKEKEPLNSLGGEGKGRQCKIRAKAKVLLSRIWHLCAQQQQRLETPPNGVNICHPHKHNFTVGVILWGEKQ